MKPENTFETHFAAINSIIGRICYGQKLQSSDFEDIQSYVYERLIEKDYRILREYQSAGHSQSYLLLAIKNIHRDYGRLNLGRWHSSVKAGELGEMGILLEKLLYRRHYSFDEACEIILTISRNQQKTPPSRKKLEAMAVQLKKKPRETIITPGDEVLSILARSKETAADDALQIDELKPKKETFDRITENLKKELTNEDRLILKMKFEDGLPISKIARVLTKKRYYIDQRLKDILHAFKDGIVSQGVDKAVELFRDQLPNEDHRIIKMQSEDKQSVSKIASVLNKKRSEVERILFEILEEERQIRTAAKQSVMDDAMDIIRNVNKLDC